MSEGAQLPWKVQRVNNSRGPPADYSSIRLPLPPPPSGMEWHRDTETREFSLVQQDKDMVSKRTQTILDDRARNSSLSNDEKNRENIEFPSASDDTSGGVEGDDYILHTVLPTDTLAGLCITYKINAIKIRQTNRFSGSNLLLAPPRLIIPLSENSKCANIMLQDKESAEYKIQTFLASNPNLRHVEARSYLELNDWNLSDALNNAKEDAVWEGKSSFALEHGIKKKRVDFTTVRGAGDDVLLDVHVGIPAHSPEFMATTKRAELSPLLRDIEMKSIMQRRAS